MDPSAQRPDKLIGFDETGTVCVDHLEELHQVVLPGKQIDFNGQSSKFQHNVIG